VRFLRLASVVAVAAVAAGCLQADTLVKVKADGSGTIEQTVFISQQAMGMMGAMSQMGGQKEGAPNPDQFFNEATFRDAAGKLGPGVTFVSMQPLTSEGMKGVKATYAFTDITQVRVDQGQSVPGMPGQEASGKSEEPITFQLRKQAGGAAMTITMPKPKPEAASEKAAASPEIPQQVPPEMMGMMQMMLKGMKVKVAVEVAGKILKTDAAHHTANTVTLIEVDMDTLMEDPAMLQALQGKLRPGASPQELQAAFSGMKGVKFSGPVVNVEWR
jgi:hypothetical protein